MEKTLYLCPYDKAVHCSQEEPCFGCESWKPEAKKNLVFDSPFDPTESFIGAAICRAANRIGCEIKTLTYTKQGKDVEITLHLTEGE